jgi:mono/diheme cytochrome c family protein
MRILMTVVTTLIVLVAMGALYVWSGVYNVAASEPHDPVVRWFLTTLQSQAVAAHSDGIAPSSLTESTRIRAGAHIYDDMCRMCHGAPGHDPSEIGQGLNPQPPKLWTTDVQSASDAELYWVVKHGIKMTGMPAFGPTHEEAKLWSVVAFVRRLPELQPEVYRAMLQTTEANEEKDSNQGEHQQH